MDGSFVIIGTLVVYILYLHLRLWLVQQVLNTVRPSVMVARNSDLRTPASGGCGALFILIPLTAVALYLIYNSIR